MKKYNGTEWVDTTLRQYKTSTDTLTTLPADVYADGNNATVGLKGNTVQNGTPTPDNPIMPQGTGERTGNLFDVSTSTNEFINSNGLITPSAAGDPYYLSDYISADNVTISVQYKETAAAEIFTVGVYDSSKSFIRRDVISNNSVSYENVAYIRINYRDKNCQNVMLNTGSTPQPYEPYGYKIPISSANTTTPVYLGEVETTRRIRKYEFDGTESILQDKERADSWRFYTGSLITAISNVSICSHFEYIGGNRVNNTDDIGFSLFSSAQFGCRFPKSIANTTAEFKAWLAAQYSAGTPVTLWYILAEPTTGIVNEPIRKIGDYADTVSGITIPTITGKDTFDVETTLKPSAVSLNYTGWHDAEVKDWDGSNWQ